MAINVNYLYFKKLLNSNALYINVMFYNKNLLYLNMWVIGGGMTIYRMKCVYNISVPIGNS